MFKIKYKNKIYFKILFLKKKINKINFNIIIKIYIYKNFRLIGKIYA